MNVKQSLVLELENFKCKLLTDVDCSLGQLYDYACALQSFIKVKMDEAEKVKQAQEAQKEAPNEQCGN